MEHLFLECAVRAALLVAGTALVLYTMRVKTAAARHSVWASVVLLMLVLPIWTAWGPKAPLRLLPPLGQTTANEAILSGGTISTAFVPSPLLSTRQAVLLGVYLLGLCLLLSRLAIGTVRARRLVRDALLQDGMHISSLCAAPVTVGFFRPTVIVPEHWRQWPQAQLDAVLMHESEHARRRDSLVQWLALLNRALFWFHPAAWWLERRLSGLAEEACDNVVLMHGHGSPREYAEYLIDMALFSHAFRSAAERRGNGDARQFPATAYSTNHGRRPSATHFTHADGVRYRRLRDYVHGVCRRHTGPRPAERFRAAREWPIWRPSHHEICISRSQN